MFFLDFSNGSTKGTLKNFRRPSGGISYTIAVLLNRAAKILINIERYFVKDNFSKGRYFEATNFEIRNLKIILLTNCQCGLFNLCCEYQFSIHILESPALRRADFHFSIVNHLYNRFSEMRFL